LDKLKSWLARRNKRRLALCGALFLALSLSATQQNAGDAKELLARGAGLISSKPAEAVKLLRQALQLDPDLPTLRYQLGLAYHAIGDEADAAGELREAVNRAPDSAAAHNYLGIVLFQMGDAKAALEEFRAAATLAPKDPNAHFNLGEAMARTGDSAAAVEELRLATELVPGDTGLVRLLNSVETALAASENRIRVEVKQVLVPVVVTDREGHSVTGLSQADFKVFENGVEQKITAFSVEQSGLPKADIPATGEQLPPATAASPGATPQSPAAHAGVRRTYMICIDTLHASFNRFAAAREALVKLFQQENAPGSQYVVVALGASAEMVLNVTSDPTAVLGVFQSKRFQKIFLDGQLGGVNGEMERFRRDLVETREACNLAAMDRVMQPKCESGMSRVNQRAAQIAELDRTLTVGFLREFRALISQLAHAGDRRTVILLSDGFEIEPGREAFALVNAYFPFASHCLVPPTISCLQTDLTAATRLEDEFEPILQIAAKSNVTIDTIDSRGLYGQRAFDASNPGNPPNVDGAVGRTERDAAAARGNTLVEFAEATGGTAFHDSNNLLGGLRRAFADGRDYYTLAYVSSNASFDGKFRAITVQVRARNAVVNAKRGYWAAQ
jgi:VWFA-related protein